MASKLYQMALHLRERLAANAEGHIDSERDALELVGLVDDLIRAMEEYQPNSFLLVWPCDYRPARISHPYGEERDKFTHEGVDMLAPIGTIVRAPAPGEVFQASEYGAYGKRVAIRWLVVGHTYEVYLAHLSRIDVRPGQLVAASQQVGLTGNSGNSTGPHLHLTLRDPANPLQLRGIHAAFNGCIDPEPFLIKP